MASTSSFRSAEAETYRHGGSPARGGVVFRAQGCDSVGLFSRTPQGARMTIKVGDRLPAGKLSEYVEVESAGCPIGPNEFNVDDLTRGRKVAIFGLPGAFTPTCSAKHVPSYLSQLGALKAKGIAEVICMSVNDAFVMGASCG
jgi:hypothetical protein